jgi:hypothetical protein
MSVMDHTEIRRRVFRRIVDHDVRMFVVKRAAEPVDPVMDADLWPPPAVDP